MEGRGVSPKAPPSQPHHLSSSAAARPHLHPARLGLLVLPRLIRDLDVLRSLRHAALQRLCPLSQLLHLRKE